MKSAADVISQDSSNFLSKSQTVSILKECHRFSLSIVNMESWPFSIFWETKKLLLADDTWTMWRREHKNSRSVTCRWKWLQYKWHGRHPSTFLETTELLIGVILSDCSLWNLWIKLSRMVYGNGGEDTILNLPRQMFSEKSIDLPWIASVFFLEHWAKILSIGLMFAGLQWAQCCLCSPLWHSWYYPPFSDMGTILLD